MSTIQEQPGVRFEPRDLSATHPDDYPVQEYDVIAISTDGVTRHSEPTYSTLEQVKRACDEFANGYSDLDLWTEVPRHDGDARIDLVVDGLDEYGSFARDGHLPPFVVFCVTRQTHIAGPFATRDLATAHLHEIRAGQAPRLDPFEFDQDLSLSTRVADPYEVVSFRAECDHDVDLLMAGLGSQFSGLFVIRERAVISIPDVIVELGIKGPLTVTRLQEVMRTVPDSHVMLRTLRNRPLIANAQIGPVVSKLPEKGSVVTVRLIDGAVVEGAVVAHGTKDGMPIFDFEYEARLSDGAGERVQKWAWPGQVIPHDQAQAESLERIGSDALLREVSRRGLLTEFHGAVGALYDNLEATGVFEAAPQTTAYLAYRLRREEAKLGQDPNAAMTASYWQQKIDSMTSDVHREDRPRG